jgi:methylthioribose-1-phosphate isomerase
MQSLILPRDVIAWTGASLRFLDQTALPAEERLINTSDYRVVIEALRTLRLRGAPLIGVAAAYAAALAANEHLAETGTGFHTRLQTSLSEIASARPTAVNLFHAVDRMRGVAESYADPMQCATAMERTAAGMHEAEAQRCIAMGEAGAVLLPDEGGVVTICNTGALATGGIGTALGVIATAVRAGKRLHVYACETRPLLQGARLTMWELARLGIPATLIVDGAVPELLRRGEVRAAIAGADRIACNGDTANKIGTCAVALAAHDAGIPFYIAAPVSTIDFTAPDGGAIPIELRGPDEVRTLAGIPVAAAGCEVWNPAFDVTPHRLISAIITDCGVLTAPLMAGISRLRA